MYVCMYTCMCIYLLRCKYIGVFSFTQKSVEYMIKADYVADASKVDTREILEEYKMFSDRIYPTITEILAKLLTETQSDFKHKCKTNYPEYGSRAVKLWVQIQFNKVLGVRYMINKTLMVQRG